jgi:sulfur relay (sulfurtransferase) DsrC/TusE family protein
MTSLKPFEWKDIVAEINKYKEDYITNQKWKTKEQYSKNQIFAIPFSEEIISKETILLTTKMNAAVSYFKNFYTEFAPNQKFSKNYVEFIVKEIIDEAEHKINLHEMDERHKELRKNNPNIDAYIHSLFDRGPYPV